VTAIARWLAGLGAHYDVVSFLEPYGSNWSKAWSDLPRGDWMLGIAARIASDTPALVRAAAACARIAMREGGASPDASRAVEMAEDWATREGSPAALLAEAERLEAMAETASSAAERAVLLAAAGACRTASDPTFAVSSALQAVEAAVDARGSEDPMRVITEVQAACAKAVRTHLPTQIVRSPFGG
jgi:hypothetical protein